MKSSLFLALWRGFKKKCPRCGLGPLFKNWFILNQKCLNCSCVFQDREDDTYFFMYISTGFLTGLFIVVMFFVIPLHLQRGKIILLLASVGLFVLTHPYRKGLAIAIDYLIDSRSEHPKHERKKLN